MAMNTLKDIYIDQIKDLYSADKQALEITQKLAEAATDAELKSALEAGVAGIRDGMNAMSTIAEAHGDRPEGEHCKGMEGLVAEAKSHALEETFGDDDARDAMIITQYQRMAHYAIAGYGCLAAFADRLGLDQDAKTLKECLEASYDGDRHMTKIATSGINAGATA